MAEKVGSLLIDLAANVARLQQDMNKASSVVNNATEKMGKAWESFRAIASAGIAGEALREVVKAAADGERSVNLLTAAFKRQGDGIGFTRDELEGLAEEMSKATEFKDSDFRKAEATLLSFGNIYGDVFKQAITLSADLAAKDGNLAGATDAIGKALANPIEGMKGLGAAIGKLTPQQTEMIKNFVRSNDVLGAQNYILGLVRDKVGGTAAELNTGYNKGINDAAKSWDNFKEALGRVATLKNSVVDALEAITLSLRGLAAVFEGKSFGSGIVGDRSAMAQQITELQDQIATAKGRQGLTFTDDQGRVIGEDLHLDDMEKKLKELTATYDSLYQSKSKVENKATKTPKIGLTEDQLEFLKQIKRQGESIGEGPTGGLFAKAKELNLNGSKLNKPSQTQLDIQKIGQAMKEEADEADRGAERISDWKKAHDFMVNLDQDTDDIKRQTLALGDNAEQMQILAANVRLANQMREIERDLTGDQRLAFETAATTISGKYIAALRESIEVARQWQTGVKQAFNDLQDQANDKATQAKNAIVSAFQGMEDALVKFAQTGKLNFNDLANSIIADLIRIQIKQNLLGPLAAGLGGLFGGGGGASAVGGSGIGGVGVATLATGTNYVPQDMFAMIHKGEAVVPREYNNGGNGSGSSVVINQSINVDSRSDFQSIAAAMSTAKQQAKAEILNSISRNGQFAGAVRSVR